MTFSFRSVLLTLLLSLALVGCGTTKKKATGGDGDVNMGAESTSEAGDIELNADSDSGKVGSLRTVFFAYDSATLNSSTREQLSKNVEFLKANTSVEVQIEGHCYERGGVQYNLALGERRAKAVKDYMVAMGVSSSRVSTISFGKERPVAFGHDESAWGQNRRANFVVTAK